MNTARGGAGAAIRRPLMGVACLFIAGTSLGLTLNIGAGFLLPPACACALLSMVLFRRRVSLPLLWLGTALAGWAAASLAARSPSAQELGALVRTGSEYVRLVGVVVNDPDVSDLSDPSDRSDKEWSFLFRVEGLRRLDGWQRARGVVAVRAVAPARARPFAYGERWELAGALEQRARRRVSSPPRMLHVERDSERWLSSGHGGALRARCFAWRHACARLLGEGAADYPEQVGLVRALMLNYRQELPPRLQRVFSITGTLHIFAISGSHVGVMAVLVMAALKAAGLSRRYWILGLGPVLLAYTAATGMQVSAVRACLMALLYFSAPLVWRRPDGPSALAAAAILILAWSPLQLLDPGFLLSFVVVAGIMAMYPVFARFTDRRLRADPWRLQPEPAPAGWLRRRLRQLGALAATSLSAWLASTPLSAYYFNVFSPVALLANILVIPAAVVIMLTACLTLVLGSSFSLLAEVFNHANRVFVSTLVRAVSFLGELPGGYRYVQSPPGWAVAAWFVVLAALLMARSRRVRLAWVAAACAALAMTGLALDRGAVTVDVLSVGQGSAAFINLPGGGDVLMDTGPDFFAASVLRHLRRQGVDRLGIVVLSHPDANHVGAAAEILRALPVGELWCCPFGSRSEQGRRVLQEARERGVRIRRLERGERGAWPGGVEWEVLHPDGRGNYGRAGDASLVMRVARGGASVLFMGGAGALAEAEILGQPVEPAATVLAVGDHGTVGTCTEAWLEAVAPRAAVISVGRYNRRGDPDPRVLERLAGREIEVRRTDRDGPQRVSLPDAQAARRAGAPVAVTALER